MTCGSCMGLDAAGIWGRECECPAIELISGACPPKVRVVQGRGVTGEHAGRMGVDAAGAPISPLLAFQPSQQPHCRWQAQLSRSQCHIDCIACTNERRVGTYECHEGRGAGGLASDPTRTPLPSATIYTGSRQNNCLYVRIHLFRCARHGRDHSSLPQRVCGGPSSPP